MSHKKQVRKLCALGKEKSELLKMAMSELNFSVRAYDKILKVSRMIADLAGSEDIKTEHLSEAIQYRSLDRDFLFKKQFPIHSGNCFQFVQKSGVIENDQNKTAY
jgi:hypothetical protein